MNNSNKKRLILLVLTLIMCLGVSYAAVYFINLQEDSRTNELETGLISIAYTEGSDVINLEDTVPVIDEVGLENDPYQFSVKNTSKIPINLKFQVVPSNNSQIPAGAIRYGLYINDELIEKGSLGKNDNTIYLMNNFKPNDTISAKLILWVDYYYETGGETFSATVKVTGESFDIIYEEPATDIIKKKLGTGGLVAVNTDGDLYDGTGTIREYRYSGPTVDNYAYFNCQDTDGTYNYGDTNYDYANNCEVWRIIGIFNDNGEEKVKLVRNTVLTAEELPENYVIDGTTYTIASSTTSNAAYWNKVPSKIYPSTNKNDWTKAGLQYYLNTEQDETDTSDGVIIANKGYLKFLTNETKKLISFTTYYLGNTTTKTTSKMFYTAERSINVWDNNKETWNGLVALMYPSDYAYSISSEYWDISSGEYADIKNMQWLNHYADEWFLSPFSDNSACAINWDKGNGVDYYGSDGGAMLIRPTLHLTPSVKILKGTGTDTNPYIFVK